MTSVFTLIPVVMIFATMYTVPQGSGNIQENPFVGSMGILFFAMYGLSLLVSFLLMNIIYINAGFQYYDSRTDLHRSVDLTEIDTIGSHEI